VALFEGGKNPSRPTVCSQPSSAFALRQELPLQLYVPTVASNRIVHLLETTLAISVPRWENPSSLSSPHWANNTETLTWSKQQQIGQPDPETHAQLHKMHQESCFQDGLRLQAPVRVISRAALTGISPHPTLLPKPPLACNRLGPQTKPQIARTEEAHAASPWPQGAQARCSAASLHPAPPGSGAPKAGVARVGATRVSVLAHVGKRGRWNCY
jgi:hypothetical protein